MLLLFDQVLLQDYIKNLFNFDVEYEASNPIYLCLFGKIHVLNAAKALTVLELAVMVIYMVVLFPWWILWIVFHLLLLAVTIYALKKERGRWMWPAIGFSVLQFFSFAILVALLFVIGIFSTQTFLDMFGQGHHTSFAIRLIFVILVKAFLLGLAGLMFWRFTVFYTTKKYFDAKQDGEIELTTREEKKGIDKLLQPI